jgi:hypothetical protein
MRLAAGLGKHRETSKSEVWARFGQSGRTGQTPSPDPSGQGSRTRPGRVLDPAQTVQTCLTRQVPPGQVWHFSSLPDLTREPPDPGSGTPPRPWFGVVPGSIPGSDPTQESSPNRPQKVTPEPPQTDPKSWSTFDQLLGSVWGRIRVRNRPGSSPNLDPVPTPKSRKKCVKKVPFLGHFLGTFLSTFLSTFLGVSKPRFGGQGAGEVDFFDPI